MPVLEAIHDEVEAIEDRVLAKPLAGADIERLYEGASSRPVRRIVLIGG